MALMDPYAGPWTDSEAAHLARRAGFGATPAELTSMVTAGMSASVDARVDYAPVDSALEAQIAAIPPSTTTDLGRVRNPFSYSHLAGWWLYRMRWTNQPLQEQYTLMLHDTLVSDYVKTSAGVPFSMNYGNDGDGLLPAQSCTHGPPNVARDPTNVRSSLMTILLLKNQHNLFRTIGHQGYRDMLRSITRDPAMLQYLDNRQNVKGRPQENYAREVMELFSMGVGNYTELDVRENARAFTGETFDASCLNNWPMAYLFVASLHDMNSKIVFGNTFNLGLGDTDHVIDLILAQISMSGITPFHGTLPAASIYMAWKLIIWFVNEHVPIADPAVGELATILWNGGAPTVNGYNYDVREALRTLLKSQFFYDAQFRYKMYKHPADYMAMALRSLALEESGYTNAAASFIAGMGMALFNPPNVAGWNHGEAWINSGNLINRFNWADHLSTSSVMTNAYCDGLIAGGFVANQTDHAGMIEYFRARLIQAPLRPEETTTLNAFLAAVLGGTATAQYYRKVRGLAHLMLALPQYQLK